MTTRAAISPQDTPRGFWPFIILQAQGAFSDNVFKQMMLIFTASLMVGSASKQELFNSIIGAMYIIPTLLFSCWAGFLADKFSKRSIALATKVGEVLIMTLACAAMSVHDPQARLWAGIGILFLIGTQFAVFSPAKYGVLPELVGPARLSWANGVFELLTFVSIILGVAFAGYYFRGASSEAMRRMTMILAGLGAAGLATGFFMRRTPAANPSRPIPFNFFPELRRYFGVLRGDRTLALTVLGLAYFWGLGVMLLMHVIAWGEHALDLDASQASYVLFSVLALGIALGSGAAGKASHGRIELGLVPLGGVGMALFSLPLGFANPSLRFVMSASLFMLGVSAGFFSVPLGALLQQRTDPKDRGGLLAASNYITALAMMAFVAVYALLSLIFGKVFADARTAVNMIFVFTSLISLAATVVILRLLPEALVRFVALMLTNTFYRLRILGRAYIPEAGPTLIVSNHVSFIDAVLIQSAYPRPVRFVVWQGLYKSRALGFLLRTMRSIPVAPDQKSREMLHALRVASDALKAGEVVCIFAEGQITRTGMLLPIQRGYEYILKNAPPDCPVLPAYLDGLWGSIFSFERGRFFWKKPRTVPYPVRVAFGPPLPPTIPATELRRTIEELGAEASRNAAAGIPLLHHQMIRVARRRWSGFAMIDANSAPLTHGETLWRSILLARRLAAEWKGQTNVGILLPPSVGGALVNYAAALGGRTAVNLNYTTGQAVLEPCARRAELTTIVTHRDFLGKIKLETPGRAIFIEDYRGYRGWREVLTAMLMARFATPRMIERYAGAERRPGGAALATIIFSSGSTGEPKGVMLSHANIAANIESFRQGIRIWPHDRLLGTLPFFHSFGYTVALWGSALAPFGAVWHANPLDVKLIGELCEKHRVTLIITTPTFLQHYLKRVAPAQLGGLTCVITGAERLPDRLREAFQQRFGIEPLQGYGTTECAPVVACNVDDHRGPGTYQVGHKRGSIGHPLPGVAVRIVDVDSGEIKPPGEAGLLLVRGANVMQGYLGMPEKTAEVLRDGWYNTGDVAKIDEDGFIFITDRLSRFSKIGGEMAPHVAIEEKLHEALGCTEPCLVVTAVPDEKKGEQLVVLHTLAAEREGAFAGLAEKTAALGMPNLWIPRRENFFRIEAIPLLGTGKLDLAQVRLIAAQRVAARQSATEAATATERDDAANDE